MNNQGGIIGFLISKGIAKDEAQANVVMLCFVAVGFIFTGYVMMKFVF